MAAQGRWLLGTCLWVALAVPAACGDTKASTPASSHAGESGSAGESNGAAGSSSGGGSSHAGESSRAGAQSLEAGADSGGALGLSGGGGAESSEGGSGLAQGGEQTVAGAGGTTGQPSPERLSFCPRLAMVGPHSDAVGLRYSKAVYNDLCVRWLTDLYAGVKKPLFLDQIGAFNLKLWGCKNDGTTDFALVFEPVPLSQGDADSIIQHYIDVTTLELGLSPGEVSEMRAALERLAKPLVVDPSTGPSHTECLSSGGSGGTAGSGGAGADAGSGGDAAGGGNAGTGGDATGSGGDAGAGAAAGTSGDVAGSGGSGGTN